MGSNSSTQISQSYQITGNNNGITGADQNTSGITNSSSTDVTPNLDLNYSDTINPNIGSLLGFSGTGLLSKVKGTIKATGDIIEAVKHASGAVKRVALGDSDLIQKADGILQTILTKDPIDTINGEQSVDVSTLIDVANLNKDIVGKMRDAHDAYGTLAIGMTGMRNTEVSSIPTELSMNALYARASELERLNKDEILASAGPRMGIIKKRSVVDIPTVTKETLDNVNTEYGKIKDIRIIGKEIEEVQVKTKFSLLHANSDLLRRSNKLLINSWETNDIIGMINQVSVPIFTEGTSIYPGGLIANFQKFPKPINTVKLLDGKGNNLIMTGIAPTQFIYTLPIDIAFRDTYMILSGDVFFNKQPLLDGVQYFVGLTYLTADGQKFQPAHYINKGVRIDQVSTIYMHEHKQFYKFKSTEQPVSSLFSFSSQFQVLVNVSKLLDDWYDWVFAQEHNIKFKVALSLGYIGKVDKDVQIGVNVQVPSIRIETISNPTSMIYMGSFYSGVILDLLGNVPPWYTTGDNHDPVFLYKLVLSNICRYLGRIAVKHVSENNASLALSIEHINRARVTSLLLPLDREDAIIHIRTLISSGNNLIYNDSPIASYKLPDRKILFQHLIEKVALQLLTNVSIWGDRYNELNLNYISDMKQHNSVEVEMDKALLKMKKC